MSSNAIELNVVLVHPYSSMSPQYSLIDTFSRKITRPPTSLMLIIGVRPVTWNIGSGA
jgi:hypothetical protein